MRELVGFVAVGAANTLITYGIYVALQRVIIYSLAFTAAYLLGIFSSYALNSKFVFNEPLHWAKAVQYPVVYAAQYLLSVCMLFIAVEWLDISALVAPLIVLFASLPFVFALSRFIIKRPRN